MKRFYVCIATFIVLIVCTLLFSTCKKEYSFEGGILPDIAAFTLAGAGATCTGSTIMGIYKTGVSLTAGNTIQLDIVVTKIGSYNVSTNLENGIQFSTSGAFADTGKQSITLIGNGTPVSTGSYSFIIPVGPGCSFVIDIIPSTIDFASFTLAGSPDACQNVIVNGDYYSGYVLNSSNTIDLVVDVIKAGDYILSTDTIDGISFSTSGTFTTIGNQRLKLLGTGTPPLPGNLVFKPIAGISSCNFTVPVLAFGPPATYVLVSKGGIITPCISTLSGTCTKGVPLTNTNTITEQVFVTAVGNYAVVTNKVNGMVFYQSGTFTATGEQYVVLKGVGTPLNAGQYVVVPEIVGPAPLGGSFCGVEVEVK